MLLRRDPGETYRRIDFDARVNGADSRQLVELCMEQMAGSLGRAIYAAKNNDNAAKSAALTRAVAALTALELGVNSDHPTGGALMQFYQSARRAVLDCVLHFDSAKLEIIRADFIDVRQAMLQTSN